MQPGCWFVENVNRAASRLFCELGRQLDALRFSAGKRGSSLTELQVTKPDVEQRIQFVRDARHVSEKSRGLVHGQVENVCDIFTFVSDLERLAIVAPAVADLALDINVRQKMHLDFDQAAALAILAPATFDVETEPAGTVTAHPRSRQLREQFANRTEGARVGHWIRTGRPPNRALIDHDRLIDLFGPAQRAICARSLFRIVKTPEERAPQNVVHQRRLTAARNTGHTRETTKRESDIDVLQIIFGRAFHNQPAFFILAQLIRSKTRLSPVFRNWNTQTAREVIRG